MERFRSEGFVGDDSLSLDHGPHAVRLSGEIACRGEIVITVDKTLRIVDGSGANARVLGVLYSYNVHLRSGTNVLRYDNVHTHPGQADPYHKHVYDVAGDPEGRAVWVGYENWPTLGDVIEEARTWYETHPEEIENPDAFPHLGVRGR